jgi:hypothetical protein
LRSIVSNPSISASTSACVLSSGSRKPLGCDEVRRRGWDPGAESRRDEALWPPAPVQLERPRPQALGAGRLHVLRGTAPDHRGRVGIEVLAAPIVDPIVVGPQERADHRAHRLRAIAERLARQHRGELHHARTVLRRAVLPLAERDRLMADRCLGAFLSTGLTRCLKFGAATQRCERDVKCDAVDWSIVYSLNGFLFRNDPVEDPLLW